MSLNETSVVPGLDRGDGINLGEFISHGTGIVDTGDISFTFYADSRVSGTGAGTLASPYKALSSIPVLTAGQTVGLARGSVFREEGLASAAINIRVAAYGTGAKPVINGSAVIANATFTKTAGQANVYQVAAVILSGYPNAFEAGAFLTEAADLTACDVTPGSRLFSGGVLYVHPLGSTNPTGDGKLYERAAYVNGVVLTGSGTTIDGIRAGRQLATDGPFRVGPSGMIKNFEIYQTNRHGIVTAAGSNLIDGSFDDMYWPTYDGGGFLVFNQNVFSGETSSVTRVNFSTTLMGHCSIAIDSHNSVSGNMAAIDITDCDFDTCDKSVGCADVDLVTVTGGSVTDYRFAFTLFTNAVIDGVISTNSFAASEQKFFCDLVNNDQTVTFRNITSSMVAGSGFLRSQGTGAAVDIDTVSYTGEAWSAFPVGGVFMLDGSIRIRNFTYSDQNGQYACVYGKTDPNAGFTGTVTVDSDDSVYTPALLPTGFSLTWIHPTYAPLGVKGLPAWQIASGQDANSVAN